jgi:hypothetical protein
MYHLGLYSLTGSLKILSGLPATTSFLWFSQLLNGLCGLGVYLFLDRKIGRKGALIGLIAIGLWSFQPAWYVNWSRTTSLAANTLLFISVLVTWESIGGYLKGNGAFLIKAGYIGLGALMNAGVFLYHYRVAGYYLPLIVLICIVLLRHSARQHQSGRALLAITLISVFSILLVSPALIAALLKYLTFSSNISMDGSDLQYFRFPLMVFYQYGVEKGVLILAGAMTILGLLFRNKIMLLILTWVVFLGLEAYAYLANIPLLMFTNTFGIVVILYLPAAILIGLGFGQAFNSLEGKQLGKLSNALLAICIFAGICFIPKRIQGIEDYRYLFKDEDLKAMVWIKGNTPENAVFAINTMFWAPNAPIGTDGGFWIPYWSGRSSTTDTMLASLGPDYQTVLDRSLAVMALYENISSLDRLCEAGVDYLYNGEKESYTGDTFNAASLTQMPGVNLVYASGKVQILKICGE